MKTSLFSRVLFIVFLLLCVVLPFAVVSSPPADFPSKQIITIPKGVGLSGLADRFKAEGLIRFAFVFKAEVFLLGDEHEIKSGDYVFERPLSVARLAQRISHGEHNIPLIRITIPEGSEISDI